MTSRRRPAMRSFQASNRSVRLRCTSARASGSVPADATVTSELQGTEERRPRPAPERSQPFGGSILASALSPTQEGDRGFRLDRRSLESRSWRMDSAAHSARLALGQRRSGGQVGDGSIADVIRGARSDELEKLRELECAAGSIFRELGMDAIADDEPPSIATLAVIQAAGRAWVSTDDADEPVAYLLVQIIDASAHIEQVSVHPRAARQGLGSELIETAASWARQHGLKALTLTTYRDVPWNRPYYERLGFQILDDAHMTPGLRRLRAQEAAAGLDRWPRVVMQRSLHR
jgi:GNAT superfamily N-acetyltransferase